MPVPVAVLAALAAAAANAGSSAYAAHRVRSSEKKESKRRSKEQERETFADLVQDAEAREDESERGRLSGKARRSRKKAEGLMNTAANLREAFKV